MCVSVYSLIFILTINMSELIVELDDTNSLSKVQFDFMAQLQPHLRYNESKLEAIQLRDALMQWLREINTSFGLGEVTFTKGIQLIDIFYSRSEDVNRNEIQLIGCACMSVAAKIIEPVHPRASDWVQASENVFNEADIIKAEVRVIAVIEQLYLPTAQDFVLSLLDVKTTSIDFIQKVRAYISYLYTTNIISKAKNKIVNEPDEKFSNVLLATDPISLAIVAIRSISLLFDTQEHATMQYTLLNSEEIVGRMTDDSIDQLTQRLTQLLSDIDIDRAYIGRNYLNRPGNVQILEVIDEVSNKLMTLDDTLSSVKINRNIVKNVVPIVVEYPAIVEREIELMSEDSVEGGDVNGNGDADGGSASASKSPSVSKSASISKSGSKSPSATVQDVTRLGAGTFGGVFEGEFEGKESAVKRFMLNDENGISADTLREFNATLLLNNTDATEHVPIVFQWNLNYGREGSSLIMERLTGDLRTLIQNEVLSSEDKKKIILSVCEGVKALHTRCVFHRDIKTYNILYDDDYNCKITDFGSSRIIPFHSTLSTRGDIEKDADPSGVEMTQLHVTLHYRPIEILLASKNNPINYSYGVDIWSLACVIAEIYLGEPLFQGDSDTDMIIKIVSILGYPSEDEKRLLRIPNITISKIARKNNPLTKIKDDNLLELLMWMLSYNPQQRPTILQVLQHPYFTE